ncbi:MAG TPA: glycoside hydrolase family 9 protein [Solirubrobacteraceae bacterium]|jgi:endoglucanase|nr:glycoside hydrolase family 9 protein [Solirubrobacteraceae bacterium]
MHGRHRAAATLGLALCALAAFAPAAGAASGALIRVDQVGYATGAPKRAYLMSKASQAGESFTVRSAEGAAAFGGTVGASLGAWSQRYPHVYALDFDDLRTPGTYTIALAAGSRAAAGGRRESARTSAVSPPFTIAPASSLFAGPLANALSFYENERDGPEFIPSALRTAPAHLNDEHATTYLTPTVNGAGEFKGELTSLGETIDAAGGWWDAGDYLKFVQTASYAVALQLAGVRDFPAATGAAAGAANFTEEARFGVEWLLRMWNDKTRTLYYQVGIGEGNGDTVGDHDIWRLPQEDDDFGGEDPADRFIRHRPVFRAGPPGSPVSPNLAGRDAAAFAECFQVFHATRPELAERCLLAGEHIYELADTDPQGHLLTTIPFDFYPESEWRDDLELGATELADALAAGAPLPAGLPHTESAFYLEQAAHWASEYVARNQGGGEGLNLYDVSGLADFELVRALRAAGQPAGLATDEARLIAALGEKLEAATRVARRDPFGFGFPWASADTASHGDGLSVMASEYDALTGEDAYQADAARWLGNVLGANAWGSSFVIGDGSTFPDCPQHQVANIVGSLDGSPPVLAGAVVEGPSDERSSGKLPGMRPCPPAGGDAFARFDGMGAEYEDNAQAFTNTEPAIDLTASSMLAFSWQAEQPAPLPHQATIAPRLAAGATGGL